jgi:hypothetical protein
MNVSRRAEKRAQNGEGVVDLAIFRRAYSAELTALCGRLASADWKGRPAGMEVDVPSKEAPKSSRVELVRAKEVLSKRTCISPAELLGGKTRQQLRQNVPSLDETIDDVKVRFLSRHDDTHGGHFLDLILDRESTDTLEVERNRVWQALDNIVGVQPGSSDWRSYGPNINLAYIPPGDVPDQTLKNLVKLVGSVVQEMPIQLGIAELPRLDSK